jgi:hypothetical protein
MQHELLRRVDKQLHIIEWQDVRYEWIWKEAFVAYIRFYSSHCLRDLSVYSGYYEITARRAVLLDLFLGNGSVITFPRQRLRKQWGKWGVA